MPDGNRRYAKKKNISFDKSYLIGGKTLKLLADYFIVSKKFDTLIYFILSDYTKKRNDNSLDSIFYAATKILKDLFHKDYFKKNDLQLRFITHDKRIIPSNLLKIIGRLESSSKKYKSGKILLLAGYSLEKDFNKALSHKPKDYLSLRRNLIFQNIDLIIRTTEMRLSNGPSYATSQSQMITINKFNPELNIKDLRIVWKKYKNLLKIRKESNPHHNKIVV